MKKKRGKSLALNLFVVSTDPVSICSSEEIMLQMSTEAGIENCSPVNIAC